MQRDGFLIVLEEETEKQKLQRSCFLRLIDVRPTSLRSSIPRSLLSFYATEICNALRRYLT